MCKEPGGGADSVLSFLQPAAEVLLREQGHWETVARLQSHGAEAQDSTGEL